MDWRWRVGSVDETDVLDLLTDSARSDLADAGLPGEILDLLAPQQARARAVGHAAAFPEARQRLLTAGASTQVCGRLVVADVTAVPWSQPILELVDLVVRPRFRLLGAATWMLQRVCADADGEERWVRLHVRAGSPAEVMYRRAGFVVAEAGDLDLLMFRPPHVGDGGASRA